MQIFALPHLPFIHSRNLSHNLTAQHTPSHHHIAMVAFVPCTCAPLKQRRAHVGTRRVSLRRPRRCARPFCSAGAASPAAAPAPQDDAATSAAGEGGGVEGGDGNALVRFTRPHTMRGTMIGAAAGVLRALSTMEGPIDVSLVPRALLGVVALLLGNAFIVGINQVYDVEIDRVNKPFLPVASGEVSARLAWILVLVSAVVGLFVVRRFFSPLIFGLYAFGMTIGALYSMPPFRLKRYPLLAALTISCVRGFLLNFGVYHATVEAVGMQFAWSAPIVFLAVFMSVFACVIAISKDLPDIRGDRLAGVSTFASRKGTPAVVKLVIAMLLVNYAGAVLTAVLAPPGAFRRPVMAVGHAVLAVTLVRHARQIEAGKQSSIKRFYAFIWRLFYAEYLLFPFI